MLTLVMMLAVAQSAPPMVSADVDSNYAGVGFAPLPFDGPPPTPSAEPQTKPAKPVIVNTPPIEVAPVSSAPVEGEVRASPQPDKHAAETWRLTALATGIIPLQLSGANFVFGMRGELDVFRVSATFTFDRGGVTPFTMNQTNEWNGLLGYSLVNNKWARIRLQGGMSALTGDAITSRFGPSAGITASAGLPFVAAEVATIFTPVGGMRQLDARAELVLRGGVFELHGGYRVRFYDASDAGTVSTLFSSIPVAGPSVAIGLTF